MAPKYGLACLLHEKPFAGVNGSGKHINWCMADELGQQPAEPRRHAARQRPVPGLLRRRPARRRQVPGPAARRASPAPATITASAPTRRRRPSSRSSSATSSPTSSSRSSKAAPRARKQGGAARHRRRRAAEAAARRRRPQPHEPVRLHRQQVRVPRGVVEPEHRVAEHLPQRRRRPSRSTTSPPSSRRRSAAATSLEDAVGKLLVTLIKEHKRIVFNGNGYSDEWQKEAGQARPAEPAQHGRRPAGAGHAPTAVEPFEKYKVLNERELRRPLRDQRRGLQQDDQRRGPADGADGQPLHPAGGARLPDRRWRRTSSAVKAAGGERGGAAKTLGDAHASWSTTFQAPHRRRWPTPSSTTATATRTRAREVLPRHGRSRDGGPARDRRPHRGRRALRRLAAADLPRDAVHQVSAGRLAEPAVADSPASGHRRPGPSAQRADQAAGAPHSPPCLFLRPSAVSLSLCSPAVRAGLPPASHVAAPVPVLNGHVLHRQRHHRPRGPRAGPQAARACTSAASAPPACTTSSGRSSTTPSTRR